MSKNQVNEAQAQETQVVTAEASAPVAAVVPAESQYPSTVVDTFTGRSVQLYSSIVDDGTRESKIKIYNAMNETDAKLSDCVNMTLEITDLVAFPVDIVQEDGEIISAMRMIFVGVDGKTYASVATGVFSSLQKIIGVVGPAPWTPALKLTPINQPTRNGFKTLTLRLLS